MTPQSPSIIAGIDIGSNTIRVIITEQVENENLPRVIGVGRSTTSGVTKGYIINEDEISQPLTSAIRMAETMAGVKLDRVYVCMNSISLKTTHVTNSLSLEKKTISEKDITYIVHQISDDFNYQEKNRSLLHTIPLTYYLDGEELFANPIGLNGDKLSIKYALVSCLTQHRDSLISVISKAGLDITDIVASPIATSTVSLPKRVQAAGAALIDIGAETLSVSIFENNTLVHTAVIPCGANFITNDLALGLQISLEDAEMIKLGKQTEKTVTRRRVQDIIEARITDMADIIKKKLVLWNRDRLLPGGITLVGGGSHYEHMNTHIRNHLKLPTQTIQSEKIIPSKKSLNNSWLTVYGVCLLGNQQPQYRSTEISLKKVFKDIKDSTKSFIEQFLP